MFSKSWMNITGIRNTIELGTFNRRYGRDINNSFTD